MRQKIIFSHRTSDLLASKSFSKTIQGSIFECKMQYEANIHFAGKNAKGVIKAQIQKFTWSLVADGWKERNSSVERGGEGSPLPGVPPSLAPPTLTWSLVAYGWKVRNSSVGRGGEGSPLPGVPPSSAPPTLTWSLVAYGWKVRNSSVGRGGEGSPLPGVLPS